MMPFMKPTTQDSSGLKKKMAASLPAAVAALVIITAVVLGYGVLLARAGRYQAVFLDNNQVYFGKLHYGWFGAARLKDVYYLRVTQTLQPQGEPTQDIQIVQLGGELHGPERAMFIPKNQILFWENLRKDSQVVTAIQRIKKGQ